MMDKAYPVPCNAREGGSVSEYRAVFGFRSCYDGGKRCTETLLWLSLAHRCPFGRIVEAVHPRHIILLGSAAREGAL